ncbi:MAG: DMT family transporter [Spirochaetes bacterium]|nr:DMT family transporter [Spirochaetota bacterium]
MLSVPLGSRLGEFAALATAIFWTVTALCFEFAGKRVGTRALNLIRITLGFLFLTVFSWITRGKLLPLDAPPSLWFWLGLSGFVGFVIGDLLLFQAFIEIGARISMLIYSAVPPLSALLGWVFLRERISFHGLLGMAITLSGIALVVLERGEQGGTNSFRHPLRGVLFAFGGALGQAVGLILSKHGAPSYNAFSATQIRCLAGIIGFGTVILATRHGRYLIQALKDPVAMRIILIGAFFGPFLGVSLSLLAIQHTSTGVASTIMSLVPVLIILPSHLLFHEPIRVREILGAVIAVTGTVILFFH